MDSLKTSTEVKNEWNFNSTPNMPPLCDSKEAGNLYTLFLTDEILL
jgi:hypothetical protein